MRLLRLSLLRLRLLRLLLLPHLRWSCLQRLNSPYQQHLHLQPHPFLPLQRRPQLCHLLTSRLFTFKVPLLQSPLLSQELLLHPILSEARCKLLLQRPVAQQLPLALL